MKVTKIIITVGLSLIILVVGYSASPGINVTQYFWALKVGRIFVYEIDGGKVERVVEIKEISREDSYIYVKTHHKVSGYEFPISLVEEFWIDSKNNVIFKNKSSDAIYLKGPIQIGTEWDTKFTIFKSEVSEGKKGAETKIEKGICRIDNLFEEDILDKKRTCIEVNCYRATDNKALMKLYFCEGLGYTGMKSVTSGEWIEKLKSIE